MRNLALFWDFTTDTAVNILGPRRSAPRVLFSSKSIQLAQASFIFFLVCSCLSANGNVITDWDALMLEAIRANDSAPTLGSRNLAILHCAIFDSINAIDQNYQPYQIRLKAPAEVLDEAVAVAAAYTVTKSLYPGFARRAEELLKRFLAEKPTTSSITNALNFGSKVAQAMLEARAEDRSTTRITYIPASLPGQWQRTPPSFRPPVDPHWGRVKPFCLPNVNSFLPPPPPSLDSPEYLGAVSEVKALGGKQSIERTQEQSMIARFWADFSYTATPPGHWHGIAADIVSTREIGLLETARLFALLSLVQADSAIVCWESKFRYNFWRPITAIQRAGLGSDSGALGDATWESLLPTPPFPSYPSGHSVFSKAAAEAMTRFFGTDAIPFDARSESLTNEVRRFVSFSACANEIGLSRIYGGIHYNFDNIHGKKCGARIAQYVADNFLLKNSDLPLFRITGSSGRDLLFHGCIGHRYILEASTNSTRWVAISTNTGTIGGSPIEIEHSENSTFVRARESTFESPAGNEPIKNEENLPDSFSARLY